MRCGSPDVAPAAAREAVADIDEEVGAAQSDRQRGARLRAADPVRAVAGRHQRALPRVGRARRSRRRPARRSRSTWTPALPTMTTDRRAAAHRAGQPARQRAPRRRTATAGIVSLTQPRGRADSVRITVADNGTGIAARRSGAGLRSVLHDQARRHRPRPADRQEHRRRPRRHDRAWRARPARAPRFVIDLPVRGAAGRWRTDGRPARARQAGTLMTHRGSILLVDDEEKILKALGRALRDAGHGVVETTSPRHAQRLLGERTFDVLIVDNVMPELNGLDLIREIVASTPEGERPQILMMTAHATVESAIEAMKLGALDYLQKPFEIDELLVVVQRALDHQRLRTEYRYLRQRARRAVRPLRHHRAQPRDGGSHPAGRAGRGDQEHGADHGRDRHRQGAGGARDPRPQRAARHAAHQGQLRGDSRDAARIGAVRPRPRRVHRRRRRPRRASSRSPTAARSSSTRSAR